MLRYKATYIHIVEHKFETVTSFHEVFVSFHLMVMCTLSITLTATSNDCLPVLYIILS